MQWISIKDEKPKENTYCLIVSDLGWIGLAKYTDKYMWCRSEYPDVICDNIVYDVANEDITHYIPLNIIPTPYK